MPFGEGCGLLCWRATVYRLFPRPLMWCCFLVWAPRQWCSLLPTGCRLHTFIHHEMHRGINGLQHPSYMSPPLNFNVNFLSMISPAQEGGPGLWQLLTQWQRCRPLWLFFFLMAIYRAVDLGRHQAKVPQPLYAHTVTGWLTTRLALTARLRDSCCKLNSPFPYSTPEKSHQLSLSVPSVSCRECGLQP